MNLSFRHGTLACAVRMLRLLGIAVVVSAVPGAAQDTVLPDQTPARAAEIAEELSGPEDPERDAQTVVAQVDRRQAQAPDPKRLREQVEKVIALDDLFEAESRANLEEVPITFRCEEIPQGSRENPATPRRSTRLTFLDGRSLCWGACMLLCLADGAPYSTCDEVCTDICFGTAA